jgi:hypothetical protein
VIGNPNEEGRFRDAIVMPMQDPIEFAKLILSLAGKNPQQNTATARLPFKQTSE